jgi:hypothetical protein
MRRGLCLRQVSLKITPTDRPFVSEVKPMNVQSLRATRRRALAVSFSVLAAAFLRDDGSVSARAQGARARSNPRPNQAVPSPTSKDPFGQGRYSPYPVKDPTAAERAVLAGRAYRTALDEWVRWATTPPRPGERPPDDAAFFSLDVAERLGRWSLRWQEAQDNAAKSLAARYQALSDHLGRMSALEEGRAVREAVKPPGRPVESRPPHAFAEIAPFFRPIDERGVDRVAPEFFDFERPLNPRGIGVTAADQVEIAGRTYRAILDEAVDRFLASPPAGAGRLDEGAIFDTLLAERLGEWSDLWRRSQDAAAKDSRLAAARNGSARFASAKPQTADPDFRPATVRSHIERMSALESGRFLDDALKRAGRPAVEPVDMTRLRDFADVARFFRIEAEGQFPKTPRPNSADMTAASRAAAQIYRAILDGAVRRYREMPRAAGATPDARLVFDPALAERLGSWSIRWARVQATAGEGTLSRFAAVRSHIERMASLESGQSLRDALAPDGHPVAPAPSREFTDVARFFRLEAVWEQERIKSR